MAASSCEHQSLVRIQELIRLPNIGVKEKYCTWARVSLTSDKYICIRHKTQADDNESAREKILILSLDGSDQQISLTQKADSVAICPSEDGAEIQMTNTRLAYQDGNCLKVVTLKSDPEEEIVSCTTTGLRFWCWVNAKVIALVTHKSALHWHVADGNAPEKVFSLDMSLFDAEIISYKVDPTHQWLALTGLVPEVNGVSAITQLYSAKTEISQCIIAHSTLFTRYTSTANNSDYQLLCTACRDTDTPNLGKVHVIPLSQEDLTCDNTTSAVTGVITFPTDTTHYDFPVSLHASPSVGLLYVLTKYGLMFVCDLSTAQSLCQTRISEHVLFAATLTASGSRLIAVNRAGQVLQVDLKTTALMQHVQSHLNKPDVAKRLSLLLPSEALNDT